jgi:hypothetical protein
MSHHWKGNKMKKRIIPLLVVMIITTMALSSCVVPLRGVIRGSGNTITESRTVADFNRVQLDGAGTLTIIKGESEALQITADDNVLPKLTSDVIQGELILGFQANWWQSAIIPTQGIHYALTVKDLSEITINGAADLDMYDFETDSLTIEVNGAGKITVTNLTARDFEFEINGTANSQLSGEVENLAIQVNGMGNVSAGSLLASSADIEINGLGNGTVWVTDSLSVSISGGGSLNYYGYPTISQNISGAGEIDSLGEK